MNMNETQAAVLIRPFIAPTVEHDAEVFAVKPLRLIAEQLGEQQLPDVPSMIREYALKAKRLNRLNVLSDIADFMADASLIECKHVINMMIDRVSALDGDVTHLEDEAARLTSEIESQEIIDNPPQCSACNGSGEGEHDRACCMFCRGLGIATRV